MIVNVLLKSVFFLGLAIIISSCKNLAYSPSINLPEKMQKGKTEIMAGYECLPTTNSSLDDGIVVAIKHSFTDYICLQAKYWADLVPYSDDKDYLHGASLTSYFLLSSSEASFKFYLSPTMGMAMNGNKIEMGVFGGYIGMQFPNWLFLKPYASVGLLYGRTDSNDPKYYGYGAVLNIGTNIQLYKELNLCLEYSLVAIMNKVSKLNHSSGTPTIAFSYGL